MDQLLARAVGCGVGGQTLHLAELLPGATIVGHFTLPAEAWWDDFYTPMEQRIAELRADRDRRWSVKT